MWCANCGDEILTHGSNLCDYCLDRKRDDDTYDEVDAEDARQEARLLRWEASREEW